MPSKLVPSRRLLGLGLGLGLGVRSANYSPTAFQLLPSQLVAMMVSDL